MEYPEKEKKRNKQFLKILGLSVSRNWIVFSWYICPQNLKSIFSESRRKIELESEKVK